MTKKAPSWGKAIGIIMICLGGLGIFYQMYKIIMPSFMQTMPLNQMSQLDPNMDRGQRIIVNQFENIMDFNGLENYLMTLGIIGVILCIIYIISGAKLLTVKPQNYKFAIYVLGIFIAFNAFQLYLVFSGGTSFMMKALFIYSIIGIAFDIALLAILLSSNKAEYGISKGLNEPDKDRYTVDLDNEEIV